MNEVLANEYDTIYSKCPVCGAEHSLQEVSILINNNSENVLQCLHCGCDIKDIIYK